MGEIVLRAVDCSVVLCLGRAEAIAGLLATDGAFPVLVAPDEMLLVGPIDQEAALVEAAANRLASFDPESLVLPVTDAWSVWSLSGDGAPASFARLSAIPLATARPSVAQGAFCGIGSKVLAFPDRLCVMVSSLLSHHVHDRVLQLCADLRPVVGAHWSFETPERKP